MLDIKMIREKPDFYVKELSKRGEDFSYLYEVIKKDERRREIIVQVEKIKALRNDTSKMIGIYKREGKDISEIMKKVENIGTEIKRFEEELRNIEEFIMNKLLSTPNLPHQDVPVGIDDSENVEIKVVGVPTVFDFEPIPHWELGTKLDILDFDRASKISGSRFVVYKGLGARLERALINFMTDLHTFEHGYKELLPPYIINKESMVASGQFPKFEDDAFKLVDKRYLYLNPTAEVPSINMHRNEMLSINELPIKYAAFTTAFRQESGSAGRDTRGIIRLHQFNKVELIKFTKPENSYKELDEMLAHSEKVLK
ncbi:MAG: serine--tRNA ligase, partial [Candidatus Izimaplasma sp.]|nr:serine--tRNA ligase [Candidatus Izimaplasma bacterium]